MYSKFLSHALFKFFFAVLVLAAGLKAHAEDETTNEEPAADAALVTESNVAPEVTHQLTEAHVSESPSSGTPDFEDFLLRQSQEQPDDSLGQTLVRSAGTFGAATNTESFSGSELNNGPAMGMNFDRASDLSHDSGYMKQGMEQHFGARIVANLNVSDLFVRYASMRSQSGIQLPAAFASLVNFAEQYIHANALQGAESTNGFSHHTLAIQIIRASFCFGNDPFMIMAKMRRETNFSRSSVSPTGALGFSQMTSMGIKEVQDQMSGNSSVSLPGAKSAFQESIRCFTGIDNYELPHGTTDDLKRRVGQKWGFDMVFGQILVKTLVSYIKAGHSYGENTGGVVATYEDAFALYNGDTHPTAGICTKRSSVQMREEYACDVISQFSRMNAAWNRFIKHRNGNDVTFFIPKKAVRLQS